MQSAASESFEIRGRLREEDVLAAFEERLRPRWSRLSIRWGFVAFCGYLLVKTLLDPWGLLAALLHPVVALGAALVVGVFVHDVWLQPLKLRRMALNEARGFPEGGRTLHAVLSVDAITTDGGEYRYPRGDLQRAVETDSHLLFLLRNGGVIPFAKRDLSPEDLARLRTWARHTPGAKTRLQDA